jgi:hypothetical protein
VQLACFAKSGLSGLLVTEDREFCGG